MMDVDDVIVLGDPPESRDIDGAIMVLAASIKVLWQSILPCGLSRMTSVPLPSLPAHIISHSTPSSENPTFESPASESPSFESPSFESPVSESPVSESPASESPSSESPTVRSNITFSTPPSTG